MKYEFILTFHIFFEDGDEGMIEIGIATENEMLLHSELEQARDIAKKSCTKQVKLEVSNAILVNCTRLIYDAEDAEDTEEPEE